MRLDKLIIILAAAFILINVFLLPSKKPALNAGHLAGTWQGYHKGMQLQLILNQDGTCRAEFFDTKEENILFFNCRYRVSYLYSPAAISITSINSLNETLHSILSQPDVDTLKLAEFAPSRKMRPIVFEKGKIITLKRVEEVTNES